MDLNQMTLAISDFHKSVAFYKLLGLTLIVSQRDEYARFELPSGSTTLSLHVSDEPTARNTMLYFEVDNVDLHYKKLKRRGIKFEHPPLDQTWLWREARLFDPSGNPLCLYHAGQNRRFPPWRLS